MISRRLAKRILDVLLKSGGSFSEIYIQKKISNTVKLENSRIESSISGFELGCGLRICFDDGTFYAFVDSLDKESLLNAARTLSLAVDKSSGGKVLDLTSQKSPYKVKIKKYPSTVIPEYKRNLLVDVDQASRNYSSYIIQVTSNLSDSEEEIYIANSDEVLCFHKIVRTLLTVDVVARRGKDTRTGYKSLAKTCGYEIFDSISPNDIALKASRIAVNMLDAVNAPVGSLPVVIAPGFGGVIFHEACGHGLEADAILKEASVFKGMIGKKIASEIITVIDDPTLTSHWGSFKFDDEGFASRQTVLIRDGVLESYMYDLKSARKLQEHKTANGRRQSYRHIPLPRMTNTYINKGDSDPHTIIKSIKKGLYAKEFAGGQVDPATGDFVFGISEGYLIENGNICEPVKGATLIGNGPKVLKKIEAIGDDLDFAPGFCGKNGQTVPNEVGQPTILVSELTVGGTGI
ncbi:MAG: TldD/PmbA family protein [Actinobacteria bacterium]|nr:TldD/PmbA family protein [Actinomycetota bacterium]